MPSSSNFGIVLSSKLDSSGLMADVSRLKKQIQKTTKFEFEWTSKAGNLTKGYKELKLLTDELGNLYQQERLLAKNNVQLRKHVDKINELSTVTKRFKNEDGSIDTYIKHITDLGTTSTTHIKETTDQFGTLIRTTEQLDSEGKKIGATLKEVTQDTVAYQAQLEKQEQAMLKTAEAEAKRMANQETVVTQNREMYNGYKALVTTESEFTNGLFTGTKVTREYTNELGYAVKEVDKFDAKMQKVSGTVTTATKTMKQMRQGFGDVILKVSKFYVATLPVQAMQRALSDAVDIVKDFDKALTEFKKVSDLAGESLDKYVSKLGELGKLTARTKTEMVELATEFKKSGYTDEDSAILAQTASLYMNIADEELSASEASSVLISQLRAFNMTAEESMHIIDAINKVSNTQAVSSGDIGKGLVQAGSALQTYGNSFEQTISLITAGTTIFQKKSQQIARGLNTIASRISKNEEALAEYGVAIKDENGNLRSTYDVLLDLSKQWKVMTSSQRVALGTTLAGVNQFKVLSSVISQMDIAQQAYNDALHANGSAMEENQKYMESLEAKTQEFKTQWESLVLDGGTLQKAGKLFVSLGTSILKFINTPFTKWVLILGSLTTAIALLTTKGIPKLIAEIKGISDVFSLATQKGVGLKKALDSLSVNPTVLALSLLVGAVAGGISLYQKFNVTLEEHSERLNQLSEDYNSTMSDISNLEKQLDDVKTQIEQINQNALDITKDEDSVRLQNQLKLLKEQEVTLQHQLLIAKELSQVQSKELDGEAQDTLTDKKFNKQIAYITNGTQNRGTIVDFLNIYSDAIKSTQSEIDALIESKNAMEKELGDNFSDNEAYGDIVEQIDTLIKRKDMYRDEASKYAETVQTATNNATSATEAVELANEALEKYYGLIERIQKEEYNSAQDLDDLLNENGIEKSELVDYMNTNNIEDEFEALDKLLQERALALEQYTEQVKAMADALDMTEGELTAYADSLGTSIERAYELLDAQQKANESLKQLDSSYNSLTKVVSEYNENGYISVDTYEKLRALGDEYVDLLEEQDGQLGINQAKLKELIEAEKAKQKTQILNIAITRLENAVNKDSAKTTEETANAVSQLADAQLKYAEVQKYAMLNGITRDELDAITDYVNTAMKQIDMLNLGFENTNKGVKKSEATFKDYFDSMVDSLQDNVDAVEKEKDSAIQAIEDEISALQTLKDQREQYWEAQIQSLEDENDLREQSIKLQEYEQALAEAQQKRVMIFKDGRFQYGSDENAIAEAKSNLEKYQQELEYQNRLDALNRAKDEEIKSYDDRIKELENFKDMQENIYEEQISALNSQIHKFQKNYNSLERYYSEHTDEMNKLANDYRSMQEDNYASTLNDLDEFVSAWNMHLRKMGVATSNPLSPYAIPDVADEAPTVASTTPIVPLKGKADFRMVDFAEAEPVARTTTISIGNVELPQVKNGKEFVDYLQNFSADMTQKNFERTSL